MSSMCKEEIYAFEGKHLIASYLQCDLEALSDLNQLRQTMRDAVMASGATILDASDYAFDANGGLTMMLLLSESHASIHTYPEHKACFVDIFTCGDVCQPELFHEVLINYLRPKRISKKFLIRNEETKGSKPAE